jgi:hypothetical protein
MRRAWTRSASLVLFAAASWSTAGPAAEPSEPPIPATTGPPPNSPAPTGPAPNGGSVADDPERLPATTLAELRAEPDRWLGRRARVVLQFCTLGEPWVPWTSRFGPKDFLRLEAWCDRQLPWIRAEYEAPAPFLFVRVGSVPAFVAEHAHPHERFSATVEVRELLQGEPRIEVTSLVRTYPAIGEGAVIHAAKAIELAAEEGYELALSEARRALASPLPDHARADLERRVEAWERAFAEQLAR